MGRTIEQLQAFLKHKYQKDKWIDRLLYPENPLPLEKCFLSLALVTEEEVARSKKSKDKRDEFGFPGEGAEGAVGSRVMDIGELQRQYCLHDYERIQRIERKLAVGDILKECKQPKRRIYIEGAAGAGKSTLSRFMAYEWGHDKPTWSEYDWVFYIRLRDLTIENHSSEKELLHVVDRELFVGHGNRLNGEELTLLEKVLLEHPNKVLWILDGLDELNAEIKETQWWKDLLASNYHLLITTRPGASLVERNFGINLELAVLGLSDDQVKQYIDHFFNPDYTPGVVLANAEDCWKFIKDNPSLWSLSHTPILLEMLCSNWSELKEQTDLTMTRLYEITIEQLLKRHAQVKGLKLDELTENFLEKRYEPYLNYMEHLAFLGMQSKTIALTEQDQAKAYKHVSSVAVETGHFYANLRALGLVKRYQQGKKAEFAHLTIQEFFAAKYLAKAIRGFSENKLVKGHQEELLAFIAKTKWDSFYELMWQFVAGLLASSKLNVLEPYYYKGGDSHYIGQEELAIPESHRRLQHLQIFFDLLLQEPRAELEVFELFLLVKCLAESGVPNIMQKEALKSHFLKWLKFSWNKENYSKLGSTILQKLLLIARDSNEIIKWFEKDLSALLDNSDWKICEIAVEVIDQLGMPEASALRLKSDKYLEQLLLDENLDIRQAAVELVSRLDGSVNVVLQEKRNACLLDLLKYENLDICSNALRMTCQLKGLASEALQKARDNCLQRLLKDENWELREVAVEAIYLLGDFASKELQQARNHGLLLWLQSKNSDMPEIALKAVNQLGMLAPEDLLKARDACLLSWLKAGDLNLCRAAVYVLATIEPMVNKDLQQEQDSRLSLWLEGEDWRMRLATINLIDSLGNSASEDLQEKQYTCLLSLLENTDPHVSLITVKMINRLNVSANNDLQKHVNDSLSRLLNYKDWEVLQATVRAINQLHFPINPSVEGILVSLLDDKRIFIKEDVKQALAQTRSGLVLLCNKLFKDVFLYIPPSRLILSPQDAVKPDARGEWDCLKLCGSMLENILQDSDSHVLTETAWTVAIVRKKLSQEASSLKSSGSFFKSVSGLVSHAFLVIEGVKDNVRFATKIDLYAVGGQASQSSGQKVNIEITVIDDFQRFEELAAHCCCMVWGASRETVEILLKNIAADQEKAERGKIIYNMTGEGSLSQGNVQKHSCISWCIEQWIKAKLPLKRKWYDLIVVIPAAYLTEKSDPGSSCCII